MPGQIIRRSAQVFRKYGWKPDVPDFRDHQFLSTPGKFLDLPPKIDLRKQDIPILNQEELGSCTANAIAISHLFDQIKQKAQLTFIPSRLFIYYNEREMEGSIKSDSGATIRDGIKSIAKQGVCDEKIWPYDVSKYTEKPSDLCYKIALDNQAIEYSRITQTIDQLKGCLASGFPFVFGFSVRLFNKYRSSFRFLGCNSY